MQLQMQSEQKNILIFKVEEKLDGEENVYEKIKNIFMQVGIEINDFCIEAAYRLGKPGGCRPIMVRFIAARWKSLLFKKIREFNALGLAISNDLTLEERLERKELDMFKNKLINEGKQNIKIKTNKLLIGEKMFSLKDLRALENQKNVVGSPDHSSKQQISASALSTTNSKTRPGNTPRSKRQLPIEKHNLSIEKFMSTPPNTKKVKQDD